jgi:hypothetical protein
MLRLMHSARKLLSNFCSNTTYIKTNRNGYLTEEELKGKCGVLKYIEFIIMFFI